MDKKVILGSSSPRRRQILDQVLIPYIVRPCSIDESVVTESNPEKKVKKLAKLKNEHIAFKNDNEVIITADTVVAYENTIFEKPKNKDEAFTMISTLSGQVHDVFTGVMIRSKRDDILFVEQTKVKFWDLTKNEIEQYVATDEPYDKAGGYGIQSVGAKFVKQINGDYYNIVGLPISRVIIELKKMSFNV